MIKQSTISAVFNAVDIIDIISQYVKLKKAGTNHTGLCPFHNEKSPSFTVSPAKQIYKCFGCGAAGNAINFIMAHDKKTYPETIEQLADKYNIAIEYDQAQQQIPQETIDKKTQMQALINWAQQQYENNLQSLPADAPVLQYLHSRGYTADRIRTWGLGFAPADFKYLSTSIINMGKHSIATELGIIKTKESSTHDFYYNRITVPIHNENGFITGFAARIYTKEDSKYPKWINPSNSLIYTKAKTWYGLHTARQAIHQQKMAYIVEGYPDVHTMQDSGITNTIAPCGKEIAPEQIKILKRYTNHVCFIPNIDANQSGQKAVLKHISTFAAADFRLSVIELPSSNDADEYIQTLINTP